MFSVFLIALCVFGACGAWRQTSRLDRYVSLAFLALGVFGLLGLEAIDVGRELVRGVGSVEVKTTVEVK